jgi:phosphatidylglycerophosphatase A
LKTITQLILRNIATLGFVGYLPWAPGTWGTAAALLLVVLVRPSTPLYLAITLLAVVLGTVSAHEAERAMGSKDPGPIVIDEFAGYLFSMALLPQETGYLLAAFILFRFFDILKPLWLRRLEALGGGPGIMADDIAAGIVTNVLLQLWRLLIPG